MTAKRPACTFSTCSLWDRRRLRRCTKGTRVPQKTAFRRMAALLPKAMPHDAAFYHYIAASEALETGGFGAGESVIGISTRNW